MAPARLSAQQEEKAAEAKPAAATLGPEETLTGKIALVEAKDKLLVVEGTGGVTYSFVVRPSTKITSAGQKAKLEELSGRKGASVTVRFVPTRRGNVARSVEIG
jgi:hypothetical protein